MLNALKEVAPLSNFPLPIAARGWLEKPAIDFYLGDMSKKSEHYKFEKFSPPWCFTENKYFGKKWSPK